ncbi:MAG: septum formation initiator family protein [Alphaproteobacteria bacterium]|nr:septum formation initiator family protein [Alphaproteobacteria bacterium]
MSSLREHQSLLRRNLLPLIGVSLCLYFSYHLLQGERSYFRLVSLRENYTESQQKLAVLKEEEKHLAQRVAMLRDNSISKDLLEERAREVLGYRYSNEMDVIETQ